MREAFEDWCSITYYEFDTQVGEVFELRTFSYIVNVNGCKDLKDGHKFSLGDLINNPHPAQIRKKIGRLNFLISISIVSFSINPVNFYFLR